MAIVVVGGSEKDIGKTALVCAVISALPQFGWTAVKISGHDYADDLISKGPVIRSEITAGEDTDTARYLAAGARRALLVTRCGPDVPIDEIRAWLGEDSHVIFESNRIIDVMTPDVCLGLVGGTETDWKPSFCRLLPKADALVSLRDEIWDVAVVKRWFRLDSAERLSEEMVAWLRERLSVRHSA